jgi:cytochrome c-type biogenesis protein CcmH
MKAVKWITLAGILIMLLLSAGTVAAQEGEPTDDEVNAIAGELYCPVCPNEPLDVCQTQACVQWRNVIREKLAEGWSEEQIKQHFVDQYGARVLASPPAKGFNILVYILPPLAFILGVVILVRAVRSWRTSGEVDAAESVVGDDPYLAQMEEELRKQAG